MKHIKGNLIFALTLILVASYANAVEKASINGLNLFSDASLEANSPDFLMVEDGVFVIPSNAEVLTFSRVD